MLLHFFLSAFAIHICQTTQNHKATLCECKCSYGQQIQTLHKILVAHLESNKYCFFSLSLSSSSISFPIYVNLYGFLLFLLLGSICLFAVGYRSNLPTISSQLACGSVTYVFCMHVWKRFFFQPQFLFL